MAENEICCCGPKIWTNVVGWLGIIGVAYPAIQIPLAWNQLMDTVHSTGNQYPADDTVERVRTRVFVGMWLFCAVLILVDALLLIGNNKERPGFFLPWLILSWIGMVLMGLILSALIILGFVVSAMAFAAAIVLVIVSILPTIFLYAVHKRYAEIKESIKEPRLPVPMHKV